MPTQRLAVEKLARQPDALARVRFALKAGKELAS